MPTPHANEFIALFTTVESRLRRYNGDDRHQTFAELLRAASTQNRVVRRHRDHLQAFATLRNVIVHADGYPRRSIAEPTDDALALFRRIVSSIVDPPKVGATRRPVRMFSSEDRLSDALRHMREEDFSQVVVFSGGKLALLSTEGVARWVESQVADDIISLADATVGHALAHEEAGSFSVLPAGASVFDAHDAFTRALEKQGVRLAAVLVTENGKVTEKPINIITPWDLPGLDPMGT